MTATIKFHPDVLAAHAQFGGDLEIMQKCFDWPDLQNAISSQAAEITRLSDALTKAKAAGYVE